MENTCFFFEDQLNTAELCRICVNAVQLTSVGDNDWSVSDFLWRWTEFI